MTADEKRKQRRLIKRLWKQITTGDLLPTAMTVDLYCPASMKATIIIRDLGTKEETAYCLYFNPRMKNDFNLFCWELIQKTRTSLNVLSSKQIKHISKSARWKW